MKRTLLFVIPMALFLAGTLYRPSFFYRDL